MPTKTLISGLSPSSGAVGTTVTIAGYNFGATQGTSTVTFNGTAATPTSWSSSSIVSNVPPGATTGNVVVTVGGTASNGVTFTVLPSPNITGLSPTSGVTGTAVTIAGTNFGATQGTSTVTFNGITATATNWSVTSITATVPNSATSGNVVVTVGGLASNGVPFTVPPNVTAISPTSGAIGTAVAVTGTNFGASQGTSTVTFNGITAMATNWSATSITATVPSGATTGNVVVTVGGLASNGVPFTVPPNILSLSPTSGAIGTAVTIAGTNFGASQGTSTVTFNGITATPTNWSATTITTAVPNSATSGNVVVTVGGLASNGVPFTVPPNITSLSPTFGPIGTAVTIAGTNFGVSQGTSTVTFNGITATPTNWSATSITAAVPSGATTGNIVVTVGGLASNGVPFTIPPNITSLSPTSGPIGTAVTIAGTNFGASQGTSTVTFNGITATPTNWSATSITATVPSGATTGNVVVTVSGLASNGVPFTVPPNITSLSPTSGPIGTAVTIAGTNFGASQGTSTLAFNGITATPTNWSATSITAAVPSGATTGNVVVTVGGLASNGVPFAVPPNITSLSPTSGAIGTAVTIAGTNFGVTQGTSTVTFNGTIAIATNWSATSITAIVPKSGTSGNVLVTVGGLPSNAVSFTMPPVILSLSPTSGPIGTAVTIAGTNFGASQGSSTVTFNGTIATATNWSATSITTTVPNSATTGNVVVTVSGLASNGVPFTVPPNITSLSPTSGAIGTAVTIAGTNFGAIQGTSTVTFNGITATPTNWSATSITATVPSGATTGNVVVTVSGAPSNGVAFTIPPIVLSVSPTSGFAGTQVTISGTGFGSAQATGSVWLGSTLGSVVSWNSTQIVATVAPNSTTGTVQVQQSGVWSNAVPFTVSTTNISSVTPTSGITGTQVTVTGSSFGSVQGSGQIWLGTATATVQSWNDTQIVAQVGAGAASGNAMVLQNGVWSNAIPFTVNTLQIISISPTSGTSGTQVTINGTAFGALQAGGTVVLGGAIGQIASWTDQQIVAVVGSSAVTGVVRVEQNGSWSNALTFTVPGGAAARLAPQLINMAVGDTHTIQALNSSGQAITGLTWTSSDPTIASLSTDDPPFLTALAIGHVTISAGGASADVTVSPTLSPGTVLWSNLGDGSGVYKIVPAVPSSSGVADVFAFQNDGTVQAITSEGATAWTATASASQAVPDFQGGLIVSNYDSNSNSYSIAKLDGTSGQPYPAYTSAQWVNASVGAVHPDGTVFVIQNDGESQSVVGVNPITGTPKFTIPLDGQLDQNGRVSNVIVAGDGYAYVTWAYREVWIDGNGQSWGNNHLRLLRAGTDGTYSKIALYDWTSDYPDWITLWDTYMITNADTGTLVSWVDGETTGGSNQVSTQMHMAVTTGTSVSMVTAPQIPGQDYSAVAPVLQAQDGPFVGTVNVEGANNTPQNNIVSFDQSGNLRWSVPGNWQPQIATADGGLIATELDANNNPIATITFDQNGNATGSVGSLPIYSWTGEAYQQQGSVEQISDDALFVLYDIASSFWPVVGGNYSHNDTAYALIRTFSDNEENSDITVSNFSQTGTNQQTITNVLNDILQSLNSGNYAGCGAWLTGAAPYSISTYISNLIMNSAYGHGQFSNNSTAAFVGTRNKDGTLTGLPSSAAIAVNDTGAFFNAKLGDKTFTVGRRAYAGGTLKAQAAVLIHELGHLMNAVGGAARFQADANDKNAGRANDQLVDQYCGKLIGGLK